MRFQKLWEIIFFWACIKISVWLSVFSSKLKFYAMLYIITLSLTHSSKYSHFSKIFLRILLNILNFLNFTKTIIFLLPMKTNSDKFIVDILNRKFKQKLMQLIWKLEILEIGNWKFWKLYWKFSKVFKTGFFENFVKLS